MDQVKELYQSETLLALRVQPLLQGSTIVANYCARECTFPTALGNHNTQITPYNNSAVHTCIMPLISNTLVMKSAVTNIRVLSLLVPLGMQQVWHRDAIDYLSHWMELHSNNIVHPKHRR